MTSLEFTLANVLASIDEARIAGNAQALDALLARKEAICEALAAPEHAWLEASVQALEIGRLPHGETARVAA